MSKEMIEMIYSSSPPSNIIEPLHIGVIRLDIKALYMGFLFLVEQFKYLVYGLVVNVETK